MKIFCCGCEKIVTARLANGSEVYPHRHDLHDLPFWKCGTCKNFVGCHHKTKDRTKPLGFIATPEIKKARQHIHRILDPLWESKKYSRKKVYKLISEHIGREYHTAEIQSIEEARKIYKFLLSLNNESS